MNTHTKTKIAEVSKTYNIWLKLQKFKVTIKILFGEGYLPLSLCCIHVQNLDIIKQLLSLTTWPVLTNVHVNPTVETRFVQMVKLDWLSCHLW